MCHFGQGVDLRGDGCIALFGHVHRGQHKQAASAFDLEQRAKARQRAVGQQGLQALEHQRFAAAQLGGDIGKRRIGERQVAVQAL